MPGAKKAPAVEEVHRTNQPFLANPAIEGPLRTAVPELLRRTKHSHEARDLIEDDRLWFKYSPFAAPCLFFNLLLLVTIFCLTIWQGTESLKGFRDGIPRDMGLHLMDDDTEGGLEMWVRTLRWISSIFVIVGVALAAIASFGKLKPILFKAAFAFAAVLFLGASAVSWVSFAYSINDAEDAHFCERIGVVSADPLATQFCNSGQSTQEARRKAWAAVVFDAVLGSLTLVSIALIGLYCIASLDGRFKRKMHRQRYADQPNGWAHPRGWTHVGSTRRWILWFFLGLTFVTAVLVLVFSVLLAENRFIVGHSGVPQIYNPTAAANGVAKLKYQHMSFIASGWATMNTYLRLAATVTGILAIGFSFLPFRTWVASHLAAFFLTVSAALLYVSMGYDFDEFAEADDFTCPSPYKCHRRQFAATIALETLAASLLVIYVLWEFASRWLPFNRTPSGEAWPLFYAQYYRNNLDSERWVRCKLTGRVMSAKTYVYHHVYQHSEEYVNVNGQDIEEWRVQHYLKHEDPEGLVQCNETGDVIKRKDIGAYATNHPDRLVTCDVTGMTFPAKYIADHASRSGAKMEKAPTGERVPRHMMEEHLASGGKRVDY